MAEYSKEISFYSLEEREQIALDLLDNLSSVYDWEWDLKYHPDPEGGDSMDHLGTAYWTISTESRQRKLTMTMVVGSAPWFVADNFWFTKDEESYSCRKDKFKEVSGFAKLSQALERKAREIKNAQEKEMKKQKVRDLKAREAERLQGLIDLHRRLSSRE